MALAPWPCDDPAFSGGTQARSAATLGSGGAKILSPFSDELLDQLLAGYSKPEDLTGKDGILKQLTARLVERAL